MTTLLFGDRELMVRMIGSARLLVASDEALDKAGFESLWRRRSLRPQPLAILNPPEPSKVVTPVAGNFLLFEKRVPAAWGRWATAHRLKPTELATLEPNFIQAALQHGSDIVRFTPDAAEWYVRIIGCSLSRMELELAKFERLGVTKVDLKTALTHIGGHEDMKAERILKALGTPQVLKLGLQVETKKAIPLMAYLQKSLEFRKNDWSTAVRVVRKGGDNKRFDYWTGVQMFLHHTLLPSGSPREIDAMLALMNAAGVVSWDADS